MTYEAALQKLAGREGCKLATETYLTTGPRWWVCPETNEHTTTPRYGDREAFTQLDEHSIEVVYRDTVVVSIHPDHTYTLNTAGWFSATTRRRIEDYAPVRISGPLRRNMSWEFMYEERACGMFGPATEPTLGGPWTTMHGEFTDGMTINSSGRNVDFITPAVPA